jgi:hypothetical protein
LRNSSKRFLNSLQDSFSVYVSCGGYDEVLSNVVGLEEVLNVLFGDVVDVFSNAM